MADIHIEDFYKDAAKILVQLYRAFPRKATLYIEDISGPDTPDEFGIHSPRHQSCFACILWLADEGYLRYTDVIRQEAVDQAVLSHKGFLLLNRLGHPDATESKTPAPSVTASTDMNIALIRHLLSEGSSTLLSQFMARLLAG
jgi:hypothetical protein